MIHRINNIFVISFIIWASCLLLKSADGNPPQLDVCSLDNESANACCSACAYNQQPDGDLGCNRSCPADYYVIVDNNNSCNRIGEQSTSTATPTTTITEDPISNETDDSNATNFNLPTPKVPDSHYCIRQCASGEYYDKPNLKCKLCPTHCLECNDEMKCTTCYVEHDNECYQECPQGFYQSTKNSAGSIVCIGSEIESKSKLGLVIGVTVGGVVLIVLVVIVIVMVKRKKRITGKTHWDSQDSNANVSDTLIFNADADSSTTTDMNHGHKNAGLEDIDQVTFDTKHHKDKTDQVKTNLDADSSTTKAMNSGHKNAGLEDYNLVTFDPKHHKDKTDPAKTKLDADSSTTKAMNSGHKIAGLEDYDLVTFDPKHRKDKADPAKTKLDADSSTTKAMNSGHKIAGLEDYDLVTFDPKHRKDKADPAKTKLDADSSTTKVMNSGHKDAGLEDYDLVTFDPKHHKDKPDQVKTKLDADSSTTKAMNNGHKNAGLEDYDLVTFDTKHHKDKPNPAQTKLDENTEPSEERTQSRDKEEDYTTVAIPPSVETKPDLNTKSNKERATSRVHNEEDYMTVTIPPSEKTKPDNEKPEIKQEDADGDDSTKPPPLPKRLEKAKTEVEEKDENVQEEIVIIPTSLRRTNKIVVDG